MVNKKIVVDSPCPSLHTQKMQITQKRRIDLNYVVGRILNELSINTYLVFATSLLKMGKVLPKKSIDVHPLLLAEQYILLFL